MITNCGCGCTFRWQSRKPDSYQSIYIDTSGNTWRKRERERERIANGRDEKVHSRHTEKINIRWQSRKPDWNKSNTDTSGNIWKRREDTDRKIERGRETIAKGRERTYIQERENQ